MTKFFTILPSPGSAISNLYALGSIQSIEWVDTHSVLTLFSGNTIDVIESPREILDKFENINDGEVLELIEYIG